MNFLSRLLRCLRAVPLTVALLVPLSASATFTTIGLVGDTISALPSCLHYQIKGVCFFLKCSLGGCYIRTSIRVKHYLPEAVVSTYQQPSSHPWSDIGMPMSSMAWEAGSAITSAVLSTSVLGLDGAGETAVNNITNKTDWVTYKSADAYGNPAAHLSDLMSGRLPSISDFTLPGLTEMYAWAGNVLPGIINSIRAAGSEFLGVVAQGLSHLARTPAELADYLSRIPAILSRISSVFSNLGATLGNIAAVPGQAFNSIDQQLAGVDLSILGDIMEITGDLFCPAASRPFSPHFISEMDAITWRSVLPLEMLDARAYLPLTAEVSTNPLSFPAGHTWGSVYPRIGEIVQQHPVKASAVLAERVHSVISQKQQPHIYTPLEPRSGWKYFEWGGEARWQRLHPRPNSSCMKFGENSNFGDSGLLDGLSSGYLTTSDNAYSWNMWMQHDCCRKKGSFLFSIP